MGVRRLSLNPTLRAVVANVEMSPSRLLDRQLARLSGVPLTTIRRRQVVPDDVEKIGKAMTRISQVVPRLGSSRHPIPSTGSRTPPTITAPT